MTSDHPPSFYIHGTTPDEQRRLAALNEFINQGSLGELKLSGEKRILDVGCGLGQLSRAMARAAGGSATVVGIERHPEQLAEARRLARHDGEEHLVDLRSGEANTLPLQPGEWGTFDLVHARFLLEHLRDPLGAVGQMVKAARPGGRIVLEDDDHDVLRLHPEPPGFLPVWRAYMRTYDRMGNDPYIGRRLVSLLHQAGATPLRNTWIFFGSCSGHPTWGPMVTNALTLLRGAREAVVTQELLDAGAFDQGLSALEHWSRRPDASAWFAICWAEGRKPAEIACRA